jgi:hypothetical protein
MAKEQYIMEAKFNEVIQGIQMIVQQQERMVRGMKDVKGGVKEHQTAMTEMAMTAGRELVNIGLGWGTISAAIGVARQGVQDWRNDLDAAGQALRNLEPAVRGLGAMAPQAAGASFQRIIDIAAGSPLRIPAVTAGVLGAEKYGGKPGLEQGMLSLMLLTGAPPENVVKMVGGISQVGGLTGQQAANLSTGMVQQMPGGPGAAIGMMGDIPGIFTTAHQLKFTPEQAAAELLTFAGALGDPTQAPSAMRIVLQRLTEPGVQRLAGVPIGSSGPVTMAGLRRRLAAGEITEAQLLKEFQLRAYIFAGAGLGAGQAAYGRNLATMQGYAARPDFAAETGVRQLREADPLINAWFRQETQAEMPEIQHLARGLIDEELVRKGLDIELRARTYANVAGRFTQRIGKISYGLARAFAFDPDEAARFALSWTGARLGEDEGGYRAVLRAGMGERQVAPIDQRPAVMNLNAGNADQQ